jgi:hypothetical protein|tara:strand:+ start:584 stop:877 length:294 start_codon:yes stop_codon:yes gene_type:complete
MKVEDEVILYMYPVIAFHIFPQYSENRYETRAITAADHNNFDGCIVDLSFSRTLRSPDGWIYEEGVEPMSVEHYIKRLRGEHGDKLVMSDVVKKFLE